MKGASRGWRKSRPLGQAVLLKDSECSWRWQSKVVRWPQLPCKWAVSTALPCRPSGWLIVTVCSGPGVPQDTGFSALQMREPRVLSPIPSTSILSTSCFLWAPGLGPSLPLTLFGKALYPPTPSPLASRNRRAHRTLRLLCWSMSRLTHQMPSFGWLFIIIFFLTIKTTKTSLLTKNPRGRGEIN